MGTYIKVGDTIEGEHVKCVVRKWTCQGLKKYPECPKICTSYTTDLNSKAEVVKSPEVRYVKGSHSKVGDAVSCDSLSVYVANPRKIVARTIEGNKNKDARASGRHGAQLVNTRDHTIASVRVPLKNLERILNMSNNPIIENK